MPTSTAAADAGDRPRFHVYFAALGLALAALVGAGWRDSPWSTHGLGAVAAWCVFCAAANMLPVPATRHISLSMGASVNVAIAYLFPPPLAAAIVLLSSVSEWELKRATTVVHALFNRLQLAAATALASAVLWTSLTPAASARGAVPAVGIVIAAVVVYQTSNWCFVALAEWSARGVPLRRVLRGLVPSGPVAAITYLVLGFMGLVLGLTSARIGPWAVALLMLPLLSARHTVNVAGQLEQAQREQRALGDRLIDERERERVRIASDIHDVVLQQLAALQLQADSISAALDHRRPEVAVDVASQLRRGVDSAIAELRGTIASLRRSAIDDGGLGASLERFARTFRASTGIEVAVHADEALVRLSLPVALLLFECCQEALTNTARHAEATRVDVTVRWDGATVELEVVDDGIGFAPEQGREVGQHSGLALSREKVELSGGLLFISGRAGAGTTVTVRVPVAAA